MRLNSILVLCALLVFGITGSAGANLDSSFWVSYWSQPKPILYGAEEEAFYQNVKDVMFSRNQYTRAVNPGALEADALWLKEHPNVHFYIDGYASKRGDQDYNLKLSQLRAEWVKQSLVKSGVSENQIALAVGWGELYPTCLEDSDDCHAKNKVVRFTYVPVK